MGVIADMVRAGVDPDLIERVAQEIADAARAAAQTVDVQAERRREKDRLRKAAKRAASAESADSADVRGNPQTNSEIEPSRAEYNTTRAPAVIPVESPNGDSPIFENNRGASRKKSSQPCDVTSILTQCLSAETAAEVVVHRKAMKYPLTAGGAKGLVRELAACGDPEAGAREMMARGWRGFKAVWMEAARAGPCHARQDDPDRPGGLARLYSRLLSEERSNAGEAKIIDGDVQRIPGFSGEGGGGDCDDAVELSGGRDRLFR